MYLTKLIKWGPNKLSLHFPKRKHFRGFYILRFITHYKVYVAFQVFKGLITQIADFPTAQYTVVGKKLPLQ